MRIDFWTVVGLAAAALATAAGVPQMVKSWRTRSTRDLSLWTLLMAVTGCLLWLAYGLHLASLPLVAANSVGITVLSVTLYLKLRYR
jgi:MtN3 and saliva related transmembrane protein